MYLRERRGYFEHNEYGQNQIDLAWESFEKSDSRMDMLVVICRVT